MKIIETRDPILLGKLGKNMQEKHQSLYPNFFKPYNQQAIAEHFKKVFKNPNEKVFLWRDDRKVDEPVVAYLWLAEEHVEETVYRYGYKRLYLHHVAVLPEHQHNGISKELLAFADNYAKAEEIDVVELHYWPNNSIAKELYAKSGYEVYTEIAQKRISH